MPKQKTYLTQLLGTTTKARIIEKLVLEPGPLTRHALSKAISAGTGPTYEQIDQLIAIGILKEVNNKVELDTTFPFYEDIANLVVVTSNFMDDHRIFLERIDTLFGNDYYITGYIAACQNGPPIDHVQNSALIAILNPNTHLRNYLKTLSEISHIKLLWFDIEMIPIDIKRENMFGSTVWLASVERGIVDCIVHRECDLYPAILLLLQNISEENINYERLMDIAENRGVHDIFLSVIYEINNVMGKIMIELKSKDIALAKANQKPEISDTVKKAYNTLMGG